MSNYYTLTRLIHMPECCVGHQQIRDTLQSRVAVVMKCIPDPLLRLLDQSKDQNEDYFGQNTTIEHHPSPTDGFLRRGRHKSVTKRSAAQSFQRWLFERQNRKWNQNLIKRQFLFISSSYIRIKKDARYVLDIKNMSFFHFQCNKTNEI